MKLTEAYANKLNISEKVYKAKTDGAEMNPLLKTVIARTIANTSAFLNEAFADSVGTQMAALQQNKKFCIDLTTVALANLIANDLVIVAPMKSETGFIQYIKIVAGSNKGNIKQGDEFNTPFAYHKMNDDRMNYTSANVVVSVNKPATFKLPSFAQGVKEIEATKEDGKVEKVPVTDTKAEITLPENTVSVAYTYDNVTVPQDDLPVINVEVDSISLKAKVRRIAVFYSQLAKFKAKTEMGIDLGELLTAQACGELSAQIDAEVVKTLDNAAGACYEEKDGTGKVIRTLRFNQATPVGISLRDHYIAFAQTIATGNSIIYERTQKYGASYMVCGLGVIPMFSVMDGFKAASTKAVGAYFAGTLNGLRVYCAPYLASNRYFLGYNGGDMYTSAAVFAPFMAVVPTQLLEHADGANTQGFSTMYDVKILNPLLLVAGEIVNEPWVVNTKEQTA